ncbi:hypothetical protein [Phenylobacterium sp.]|uniref:hypothetical protein n=1 Tax=Phenylobacterium sp. TaxID=1871053 RepID=UPI0027301695|nr:hypothetical protein [Phenylobacterium sp.]MDP1875812.1 hypothetical protein [Phenylobacterium sp.]MDP3489189.1 hypothetical protein [Phenylobacterium sp.]
MSLGLLSACGEGQVGPVSPLNREPAAPSSYLAPPQAQALRTEGDGRILVGTAAAGARVRLATPEGQVYLTDADSQGAWRIALPPSPAPQIFGLSMILRERTVQAEGYLLALPDARLVLLRAGAGAIVVQGAPAQGVSAFDFDEEGGAVISGAAPAEAILSVRIDGRTVSTSGRADAAGRFSLPFGAPVPPGPHQIRVQGESLDLSAAVDASPAQAPEAGAFRASSTAYGLRIDWLTPGGGLQSTLLLD